MPTSERVAQKSVRDTAPPAREAISIFSKIGMEAALEGRVQRAQRTAMGLDYPTTFAGSTAHFCVYYDATTLGANGLAIANTVLGLCENDYNTISQCFGGLIPTPVSSPTAENPSGTMFNIIIAALDPSGSGGGGAYHYGCGAGDLYCDAKTNPSVDPYYTEFLLVAEMVEVFSADQPGAPWNCGASNGEGLSRVLATMLYPSELDGYTSAGYWLDNGRPDFVTVTDPTDRNYLSIGCSVLFLNYLRYQEDFTWTEIVTAGAPTLAQTYQNLTGQADALTPFTNLLQQFFPQGTPSGLTTDNPFPLMYAMTFPISGVQFRGTIGPNSSATWYTFDWPVLWYVLWNVVPTNVYGPGPQVQWNVQVQKTSGDYLTYWITITNLTPVNVDVEARFTIVGAL
jgi:hypothetical protein